jgi:hypothetical protein
MENSKKIIFCCLCLVFLLFSCRKTKYFDEKYHPINIKINKENFVKSNVYKIDNQIFIASDCYFMNEDYKIIKEGLKITDTLYNRKTKKLENINSILDINSYTKIFEGIYRDKNNVYAKVCQDFQNEYVFQVLELVPHPRE